MADKKNKPRISDAEWRVMQVLWDRSPRTASDVVDVLDDATDWSPRTVKTLLNRLVKKGALQFREDGNRYLYSPAVSRSSCVRDASQSFLDRVFKGAAMPALVHFVENESLTDDDLKALQQLLKERRGDA